MASKQRRNSGVSPHNPHGSILERPVYRNVADKRGRFQNDATAPDMGSAVEFLDRIWALYEVARYNAVQSSSGRAALPNTGRGMSRRDLFWFQLLRPDFDFSAGPQTVAQVGVDIDGLTRDGMLPNEREVVAMLETCLGEPLPHPVGEETARFNASLQPAERYRLADQFFNADRPNLASSRRASIPFIKRQIVWRGRQSLNACQALYFLELDLRRKSPIDLSKLETRYHVDCLPQYDVLPAVASRTARLAICMASVEPVTKNSWLYRLDFVQAALVARKYNAFLTAQKTVTAQKGRNPPKHMILKEYIWSI
ncbi:hypothetical protein G6M50_06610 [Agrobacterium rhizogenes]|nr:hypothetical protein [Rhizobium rhizogenes]NTJ77474.1 hypothetical protein [Rhizobium rhizogenes]